ncbi:MAG: GAF domain-containing protein, partial [Bacteroidales bacterium]|nr:GAF domain-containing protein [Bacteroidales bacterium]
MKILNYRLNVKLNLILVLFILFNISGIFLILNSIKPDFIYQQITNVIIIIVLWLFLIILIKQIFSRFFVNPLGKVSKVSRLASIGDLSTKVDYKSKDEIGEIASSIDSIIENEQHLAEFAEQIGDGNFKVEYEVLSEKDKLGSSLTLMRDKLKKLADDDMERNWSSEGLTKFEEILRKEENDLQILCDTVLSTLVKYMGANQGMIFLLIKEKKDTYLELTSAYAWEKKKYIDKKIQLGEGLIGQTAIERETIYLTDVPNEFINITSGLGDANPRSIIIIPFIFNGEQFGVMEMAFFKQLKPFER